ncbi:hypothetical protein [Nonomuraea jabiensis]|uniref:hypothetical protein n=1 Tax=Nonomuraea jabiensis TaxID=882448 RepID=UPI003D745F09
MNRLREALDNVAADAPAVNLADWAIAGSRRSRRTRMAAAGATGVAGLAVLTGVVLGVFPGIGPWKFDQPIVAAASGKLADLPSRGVGPLSHAYRTFCNGGSPVPADCRDGGWRVVTRAGETCHVPQALGYKSGPNFYPLAISRDGRIIAYYSRMARTFKVRDLASGAEQAAPVAIAEAELGGNARLELSDDGRYLAFTGYPSRKADGLIIDMRARSVLMELSWPTSNAPASPRHSCSPNSRTCRGRDDLSDTASSRPETSRGTPPPHPGHGTSSSRVRSPITGQSRCSCKSVGRAGLGGHAA